MFFLGWEWHWISVAKKHSIVSYCIHNKPAYVGLRGWIHQTPCEGPGTVIKEACRSHCTMTCQNFASARSCAKDISRHRGPWYSVIIISMALVFWHLRLKILKLQRLSSIRFVRMNHMQLVGSDHTWGLKHSDLYTYQLLSLDFFHGMFFCAYICSICDQSSDLCIQLFGNRKA